MRKACIAALLLLTPALAEQPIYVGVLEGNQTRGPGLDQPVISQRHVRVAFRKQGDTWQPMKTDFRTPEEIAKAPGFYPDNMTWTVVFDGRAIGTIASRNPDSMRWYADVGTQIITSKPTDVPVIRAGAGNFTYAAFNGAIERPLLLLSKSGSAAQRVWDPDGWKSTSPTAEEQQLAVAALRSKVPMSERCAAPEQTPIHRVPYSDDAVSFLRSYRSNKGELIFGVRLNDSKANCGFFDDDVFFDYWFVLDRQQRVRFLDTQMTPMEAADLDHSGKSAWIFFTTRGEDEDGYELFYDSFAKKAKFHWTYH